MGEIEEYPNLKALLTSNVLQQLPEQLRYEGLNECHDCEYHGSMGEYDVWTCKGELDMIYLVTGDEPGDYMCAMDRNLQRSIEMVVANAKARREAND